MKKLIDFIKPREKATASEKKAIAKREKDLSTPSANQNADQPRELFSDDYSDVGYC